MSNKYDFCKFKEMIINANNIAIFTHILPDGDAIGSSCAIATMLRNMGKNAYVYMPSKVLDEYYYLNIENIIRYEFPKEYDLIIATDCADIDRIGDYSSVFKNFTNSIAIDHHKTFQNFANINFVSSQSSSACEFLFDIMNECGYEINKEIAEFLYLGILRDTGGFMHDCTTPHTLRVVANLLEYEFDAENFNRHFMMRISFKNAMLLKTALNNLQLFDDGKIAISTISNKDLKNYNANIDDTGGLISHILSIDKVEIAVLITESTCGVHKLSLRSKYDVDVSDIAKDFGGGGHCKASGCQMYGKIEKIVGAVKKSIEKRLIKE